ncbi:MAG: hypothetical protein OEV91_07370 [Desulfobulbaceae bacterium]|nr:hypothetical protein [Desulfobulbaceae bacterium]
MSTPCPTAIKEQIQSIIDNCNSFLAASNKEFKEILTDRRINQWEQVNFHQYGIILSTCGISPLLQEVRDRFRKELPRLTNELEHLENDLGNLKTDCRGQGKLPANALPRAHKLEAARAALAKNFEAFTADSQLLRNAHADLRRGLTVETLLPLAKNLAGNKGPAFDIGLRLYHLVADRKTEEGGAKTIDDYFSEITKQETLLTNIKMSGLPGPAVSIIKEQIKNALKSAAAIKDGLDILAEIFEGEKTHVKATEERITQLGNENTQELLNQINSEVEALYRSILRFHYKAHHLDKIFAVEELILLLQLFQRTAKGELQESFKAAAASDNSPLNPSAAAMAAAETFLQGFIGFWRGIKLLLHLFLGRPGFNIITFQENLTEALRTCETFYGTEATDITAQENFINNRLLEYTQPFPYEDLHLIMKSCLHDYGKAVENFCKSFKVETTSLSNSSDSTLPLGKLLRQLEVNAEKLLK